MKNLTVINKEEVLTIDSREVAEMVEKDHSKLLRDIRTYCGYLAEAKIGLGKYFIESTYFDSNNQERPCYLLTKMGCEMVANKLTGAKGVVFTAKYVEKFNQMENHITKQQDSYMIEDPILRAKKWIQEREERNKLEEDNKIKQKLIEEQAPKVQMADRFILSDGLLNVGEVAKLFNERLDKSQAIGRNLFYKILRDEHILMTFGQEKNNPQQRYINQGYFELKVSTYDNGYGDVKTSTVTKVTEKGVNWLWNFLIKKEYININ